MLYMIVKEIKHIQLYFNNIDECLDKAKIYLLQNYEIDIIKKSDEKRKYCLICNKTDFILTDT